MAQLESDLFLSANDSIARETPKSAATLQPISARCIPQRVLERAEPRLVMSPLVEAFAVDGLANLFRACGADASLVFIELQAFRLEVETAEIKNSPHVTDRKSTRLNSSHSS